MAKHTDIAINLLRNAATFFRDLGSQNSDIQDQMNVNARTYDAVADRMEQDPHGEMALQSDVLDHPEGNA
ncbi:MAG: hypothetical protein JKY17_07835 [Magnetovibrio sp.]|nr:hypothetical protein [Magnetovibrio sp.]